MENLPEKAIIKPLKEKQRKPVEIKGRIYIKTKRELKAIRDAMSMGISAAAKKNGIARFTLYRYMELPHIKALVQEELEKAAAKMGTDMGYLIKKARDKIEGKTKMDKVDVDLLRFLARILGYDQTKVQHEFNYDFTFTSTNSEGMEAAIDTASSPGDGDTIEG